MRVKLLVRNALVGPAGEIYRQLRRHVDTLAIMVPHHFETLSIATMVCFEPERARGGA